VFKANAPEPRNNAVEHIKPLHEMATWTGLEPVTSAVTGRHSNQLNYQATLEQTIFNEPNI
jgi:hypothetical protein